MLFRGKAEFAVSELDRSRSGPLGESCPVSGSKEYVRLATTGRIPFVPFVCCAIFPLGGVWFGGGLVCSIVAFKFLACDADGEVEVTKLKGRRSCVP